MKPAITRIIVLNTVIGLVLFSTGCSKDETSNAADIVTTVSASYVGQNWATINGVVTPGNKTYIASFEFDTDSGATLKRSVSADPDTVSGNADTKISALLTGLSANTTYFYRVKAVNGNESFYSPEMKFTTTNPGMTQISFKSGKTYGSLTDIDGNVYKTIQIGTQTWMAENLKTTKLRDNTAIPFLPSIAAWADLESPAYCWYNNDSIVYGTLYNWYTVSNGKLCPSGWHVPSDAEWTTLAAYLGDENSAGPKLKEESTIHWLSPTIVSTNESGFTALPGGYRSYYGYYNNARRYAYFWTASERASSEAYCRSLFYDFNSLDKNSTNKSGGLSVRCIKD